MNIEYPLILVDSSDQIIGFEEKLKAHQLGLLHRAFSVCVFRTRKNSLEILLQQRALGKYHGAGLWTNTCCSHPIYEQSLIERAQDRLHEEMGFSCALQCVGNFIYRAEMANGLIEHELDHVLIGFYEEENPPFNPDEVMQTEWVAIEDIFANYKINPTKYTPWFAQALEIALHGLQLAEK